MSSPSDAAPDRSSAAGEETKRRLSRKRVTVITATALSLLEACGLEPSPARSEKTAGKGKKATQGEPPAEKASADGLEERQAAGSASSRERNGGRKKRSAPDRAPREAADAVPQEDASQGIAAIKAALPEIPPVIPPAETTAAAVPPGPAIPPKKTTARRRRASGTKAAPVTDTGAVPATEPAPAFGSVAQEASPPVVKPSAGQSAVEAAASVPGEDQPHSGARRRAVSRAGRAPTSGGRGRKKAAATAPASAGEAGPTTAPVPEQQPAERPMDAAALAAEADRLAAEYGLSSSGGGLVVLPGDDDWDDFSLPPDREASSARTAARGTETVPAASFPEPVPAAAPFAAAAPVAPVPEATPAEGKSSPRRRRGGGTTVAPVAGSGNASVPLAGEKGGASPAAPGDARIPEGSPAPVPGAVSSASAGHRAEGEANGTARPAASLWPGPFVLHRLPGQAWGGARPRSGSGPRTCRPFRCRAGSGGRPGGTAAKDSLGRAAADDGYGREETPDSKEGTGRRSGGPAPAGVDHAAAQHRTRHEARFEEWRRPHGQGACWKRSSSLWARPRSRRS